MHNVAKLKSHRPYCARVQVEELEPRNLLSIIATYTPAQIRAAYGFDQVSQTGAGQTIAIVDAYSDSKVFSNANTFSSQWGLPALNSTSTSPWFKQVNQNGGTKLPVGNANWGLEMSLDVEWAHAIAPQANILLVDASSASLGNLLTAVNYARNYPGVSVVSMSWGASEFSSEASYDSYFTTPSGHQGVTFVASSGDNGAGASWPAISPNVVSVGGTTLNLTVTPTTETGWSGSGGGPSGYESVPTYQNSLGYSSRTNPDVAYNADPNTGYYVYDTFGGSGWYDVGGTSAGAPQWAGLVALANQARAQVTPTPLPTLDGPSQTLPAIYSMPSSNFNDITSGSNGAYSAGTGYDLVTGLGTPSAPSVISSLTSVPAFTPLTSSTSTTSSGSTTTQGHHHAVTSAPADGTSNGFTALPFAIGLSTQTPATTSQPQVSVAALPGAQPLASPASANVSLPLFISGPVAQPVSIVGGPDPVVDDGNSEPDAPQAPAARGAVVQPASVAPQIQVPGAGQGAQRGVERNTDNSPRMPEQIEESEEAALPGALVGSRSALAGLALALGGYWTMPRDEEEEQKRARPRVRR
jgi:subtilase family serine protease